jgi:uncharacterized protein (TIRG00374 family)
MSQKFAWIVTIFTLPIGIGLLYWLFSSQNIPQLISEIIDFGLLNFLIFFIISTLNFSFYVWRWQIILNHTDHQKLPVKFHRLFAHRLAGFSFSYITPMAQAGGEPVRMGMLMSDGISGRRAVAAVTIDIAFELAFFAGFIFIGFIVALLEGVASFGSAWISILFLSLFCIFFYTIYHLITHGYRPFDSWRKRIKSEHAWVKAINFLAETEEVIAEFFNQKRQVVLSVMLLSMLVMVFRIFEVFFIGWGFGQNLTFGQSFLATTLPGLALLVPIPAGLGLFEGGFNVVFTLLGISISPLAFVAIIRLRDLIFVILGLLHTLILSRGHLISYVKSHYE